MTAHVATLGFAIGIAGLFYLNRIPGARVSKALWIACAWFFISGSRSISLWMSPINGDPGSEVNSALEGNPINQGVLISLLFVGILVLVARWRKVSPLLRTSVPVLLFFTYCLVSVMWSDFPIVALKHWTRATGDFVMVLVILTDRDRSNAVKLVLSRLGFLLLPTSILLNRYYPELSRYYSRWEGTQFFGGVTTNKNSLGVTVMIFGIGAVWQFISINREQHEEGRRRRLIAQGVLILVAISLLVTANSMTSMSCFIIGSTLVIVTGVGFVARSRTILALLMIGVVFVCAYALFFDKGGAMVGSLSRDPTLTGRTDIWHEVISLSGNPLFGTGFESFWLGDRLSQMWEWNWWHPNEAHNGYLEVFINLGWLGIFCLAWIVLSGYRAAAAGIGRGSMEARLWLAYVAVALDYNFTEAGFRMMSPVWCFLLLAAVAASDRATDVPAEQIQGETQFGNEVLRTSDEREEVVSELVLHHSRPIGQQ